MENIEKLAIEQSQLNITEKIKDPKLFWFYQRGFIKGFKMAGKYSDEDMMDLLLACTSTKHPLYNKYKEAVRDSFMKTGDFTPQQILEWYLSQKKTDETEL